MGAVYNRRIAMAIKTASFVGVFVDCCLFACCPGELGQYRASSRPMLASSGFQSSPGHAASWAMPSVLLWPSKQPTDEVHLFIIVNFVINNNRS
jgi:hypothetical protein